MSLFHSQWGGEYFKPEVVAWLVDDWKCQIIRVPLGVHFGGYLENPQREMEKIERVVDAALQEGVYVIVDWHAHKPEIEAAVGFFTGIAQKYGHHPNLIYETWNEPLEHHDWATVVKPYHERVVEAIRHHDPDNLIVLGTPFWSQHVDVAADDPVTGHNLAYTLHFYSGSHGEQLRERADAAMRAGVALFVTEWGTSKANGDDGVFIDESEVWLDYLSAHSISWCNWSLFDKQESSAALKPDASTQGGWDESELTQSGRFVRDVLMGTR